MDHLHDSLNPALASQHVNHGGKLDAGAGGQHKFSLHEVPPFLDLIRHKGLKLGPFHDTTAINVHQVEQFLHTLCGVWYASLLQESCFDTTAGISY